MTLRVGSLFSGYAGLDLAVAAVLNGEVAWHSEIDAGALKILKHRYPGVPNLGDVTAVDWSTVEPVDVLTGGYPCQPFSTSGRRKGTNDDRHLWPYVREAIRALRPRLTVLENVAGHRSLGFDRVLGDMAEDGLHVRWTSLRAVDVGPPHGRERVFLCIAADPEDFRHQRTGEARHGRPGPPDSRVSAPADLSLFGTPRASEWKGCGPVGSKSHAHRLQRDYLDAQVLALLPAPTASDAHGSRNSTAWRSKPSSAIGDTLTDFAWKHAGHHDPRMTPTTDPDALFNLEGPDAADPWGKYGRAVRRWEAMFRPAPAPTELRRNGSPRLSAKFEEWLMGLPAGWVTDVPGITWSEAVHALGNGVVPQQAAAALVDLLSWEVAQ